MPQKLTVAVAQSRTLADTQSTLAALDSTARQAAASGVRLILFPEAYLGGYPRGCSFGATVGARSDQGREQYLHHSRSAVDLGDVPTGAVADWVDRKLPVAKGADRRGDGTREELERIARETGVFVVTGLVEKSGGSLYCAMVYVCPRQGMLGKRRKVMPTGSERLIWAQGSPSTLRAVTTTIDGVKLTMGAAICWENCMPLLRHSLYSQNVNLYLAPTADARDTWLPLMRTIALESRAVTMSANQCVRNRNTPPWIWPPSIGGHMKTDNRTVDDGVKNPLPRRSSSTVTKTEDNHEITWPSSSSGQQPSKNQAPRGGNSHETSLPLTVSKESSVISSGDEESPALQSTFRRRSSLVTKTEDNHEITWPDPQAPLTHDRTHSNSVPSRVGKEHGDDFACRGGSCIVGAMGEVVAGPLWEVEDGGLLIADVDFDDCERGRLDLDVAGSYSRNDAFQLTVNGLDLSPPP
ncbi:MAG: Nitrilase [Piccolia ochrophora]|nr:MAG: Nitrilase [Piccolia ochrophora]